jgi:nucleoid DNA-binding protein
MDKKIVALLESNLRVIIPDFGAFIIRQKEPRVVVFNDQLKNNDKLLIDYMVKTENMEPEEAEHLLSDYTSSARKTLDAGNVLIIEGLGTLRKERNGLISFTQETDIILHDVAPDQQANWDTRQPVSGTQKHAGTKGENRPSDSRGTTADEKSKATDNQRTFKMPVLPQKAVKWAIIILLANIAIFTGFNLKDKLSDRFHKKTEPVRLSGSVLNQLADSVRAAVDDSTVIYTEQTEIASEDMSKTQQGDMRYYIVAGCFRDEVNADELVKSLKSAGYKAEKFGKIGDLYAVSYGSYDIKEAAVQALAKIREEAHPDAWMTRF